MTDRINHITADTACDSPGPEACFAYQTDSEFFLIVDSARGLAYACENVGGIFRTRHNIVMAYVAMTYVVGLYSYGL